MARHLTGTLKEPSSMGHQKPILIGSRKTLEKLEKYWLSKKYLHQTFLLQDYALLVIVVGTKRWIHFTSKFEFYRMHKSVTAIISTFHATKNRQKLQSKR